MLDYVGARPEDVLDLGTRGSLNSCVHFEGSTFKSFSSQNGITTSMLLLEGNLRRVLHGSRLLTLVLWRRTIPSFLLCLQGLIQRPFFTVLHRLSGGLVFLVQPDQ